MSLQLLIDGTILVTARIVTEEKTPPFDKPTQEIFEDYRARVKSVDVISFIQFQSV